MKQPNEWRLVSYSKKNFDELMITSQLARIAFSNSLAEDDQLLLAAFRRGWSDRFSDASTEEISDYLKTLDEDQIVGVVSNLKGIAHEMIFVEIENGDGDQMTATLFPDTNHPGYDIVLTDESTGEEVVTQLKATDEEALVQNWIDEHPDGEILVTEEIAEKMNLDSSGISNDELTSDVEDFIDKVIDDDSMIDSLPWMAPISVGIALFSLTKRYHHGQVTKREYRRIATALTGWKVAKLTLVAALLSVPVINVVTGTALVARMLISGRRMFEERQQSAKF